MELITVMIGRAFCFLFNNESVWANVFAQLIINAIYITYLMPYKSIVSQVRKQANAIIIHYSHPWLVHRKLRMLFC